MMALKRVPAYIRRECGIALVADPSKIIEIMEAVPIPVMAEAQALEALGVDCIEESEVRTPAGRSLQNSGRITTA